MIQFLWYGCGGGDCSRPGACMSFFHYPSLHKQRNFIFSVVSMSCPGSPLYLTSLAFPFRFYIESISYLKDNATIELFFLNAKSCIYKVRTRGALGGTGVRWDSWVCISWLKIYIGHTPTLRYDLLLTPSFTPLSLTTLASFLRQRFCGKTPLEVTLVVGRRESAAARIINWCVFRRKRLVLF